MNLFSPFSSTLNSYLTLLLVHLSDQQGISSGRLSGGKCGIPPGAVALSALHCVWDHNIRLRHRCTHFLPVWKTTVIASLLKKICICKKPNQTTIITCKCKITLVFVEAISFNTQDSVCNCALFCRRGF